MLPRRRQPSPTKIVQSLLQTKTPKVQLHLRVPKREFDLLQLMSAKTGIPMGDLAGKAFESWCGQWFGETYGYLPKTLDDMIAEFTFETLKGNTTGSKDV